MNTGLVEHKLRKSSKQRRHPNCGNHGKLADFRGLGHSFLLIKRTLGRVLE